MSSHRDAAGGVKSRGAEARASHVHSLTLTNDDWLDRPPEDTSYVCPLVGPLYAEMKFR